MSIMIDLPPSMANEAQGYAVLEGTTLEEMFLDSLARELERKRELKSVMDSFDALVDSTSARRDHPYVFNRADAYAETMP